MANSGQRHQAFFERERVTELRQLINTKFAPTRLVGKRPSKARFCYRIGWAGRGVGTLTLGNGTNGLPKKSTSLQLLLIRPKPRPGIVTRGLRQKFAVVADIKGTEVSREVALLKFDRRFLQLVAGTKAVQLPTGTSQKRVTWTLEATAEVEETWVRVSVGRQVVQLAQFQLRILPIVRVK